MEHMTRVALEYLSRGWAVIPVHLVVKGVCSCGSDDCPTPGKHPAIRWAEYSHRLPTRKEVRQWWDDEFYRYNIGMATGHVSGVVVVDLDGTAGLAAAKSLDLGGTLASMTGGGGVHLFYKTDQLIPSRVKAYQGVDIRGESGFVVLPPSRHLSGRWYVWLNKAPLAEANKALFAPAPTTTNEEGWYSDLLKGVDEGERNIIAVKLCGRWIGLGLSLEEAFGLLQWWNERNRPPMGVEELKRTVRAVFRKHQEVSAPQQITTLRELRNLLGGKEHDK